MKQLSNLLKRYKRPLIILIPLASISTIFTNCTPEQFQQKSLVEESNLTLINDSKLNEKDQTETDNNNLNKCGLKKHNVSKVRLDLELELKGDSRMFVDGIPANKSNTGYWITTSNNCPIITLDIEQRDEDQDSSSIKIVTKVDGKLNWVSGYPLPSPIKYSTDFDIDENWIHSEFDDNSWDEAINCSENGDSIIKSLGASDERCLPEKKLRLRIALPVSEKSLIPESERSEVERIVNSKAEVLEDGRKFQNHDFPVMSDDSQKKTKPPFSRWRSLDEEIKLKFPTLELFKSHIQALLLTYNADRNGANRIIAEKQLIRLRDLKNQDYLQLVPQDLKPSLEAKVYAEYPTIILFKNHIDMLMKVLHHSTNALEIIKAEDRLSLLRNLKDEEYVRHVRKSPKIFGTQAYPIDESSGKLELKNTNWEFTIFENDPLKLPSWSKAAESEKLRPNYNKLIGARWIYTEPWDFSCYHTGLRKNSVPNDHTSPIIIGRHSSMDLKPDWWDKAIQDGIASEDLFANYRVSFRAGTKGEFRKKWKEFMQPEGTASVKRQFRDNDRYSLLNMKYNGFLKMDGYKYYKRSALIQILNIEVKELRKQLNK